MNNDVHGRQCMIKLQPAIYVTGYTCDLRQMFYFVACPTIEQGCLA